ncbi:phosphate transporter [Wallemia mellicola]|nr:phosphate transporter [Wallemia mellicola]
MPRLAELDYIFAICLITSFLDAYGMGANDVANSFSTSVSSRSLSFRKAILAAAICEFLGAILVGARVASTIKDSIIPLSNFPTVGFQMLGFACVSAGSSAFQIFATRLGMPVSATHTVIGSVIGVGIASGGAQSVNWKWDGVGQVFASWGIAPAISGGFAAIIFLITKYGILKRKNSATLAFIAAPIYFFVVAAILTMAILWKGASTVKVDELSTGTLVGSIIGTGAAVALLSILFFLPYVHCQVIKKDYTIKIWHIFLGPFLWFRKAPEDANDNTLAVPDYYAGHREEDWSHLDGQYKKPETIDAAEECRSISQKSVHSQPQADANHPSKLSEEVEKQDITGRPPKPNYHPIEGAWIEPWNIWIGLRYNLLPFLNYYLFGGLRTDIHQMQKSGSDKTQARIRDMHAEATQYDNNTEHIFSFMQVMTACVASFSHGSNDVSNAIAPLAAVYYCWSTSEYSGEKSEIPVWVIAFGGIGIVIGLATYGWRLMSVLGNRLTLHSPSRGFSMELGASITVILASQFGIPVSSTQSITGATVGVSCCSGTFKTTNWKALAFFFYSWCITLPLAGIVSGCLFGIIANAPGFHNI